MWSNLCLIKPMVGYTDEGRLVTCMELYYSEQLKCGAVQIRAPPTSIKTFVSDFAAWFANSGKLILLTSLNSRESLLLSVLLPPLF